MMAFASEDQNIQFRTAVVDAAQRLNKDNRERLVYVYELPPDDKEKSGLSILMNLQMRNRFSVDNSEGLVDILKNIHRSDIAKDFEKQIKKWRKAKEKKGKPAHAPSTLLKTRFDEIVEQAANLVDQVAKLREQIEKEGESDHLTANELLQNCEEEANKLQHSLRRARSAGKLSDRARQMDAKLGDQLSVAVRRVSQPMREKMEEIVRNGSNKSVPAYLATPTLGRKVPLLPPSTPPVRPHARTVSRSHEPESCEYYDSFDLLLRNPDLKVEPKTSEIDVRGPIPTPRSEELKKRLTTTSADAEAKKHPPTKIPTYKHTPSQRRMSSSRRCSEGSENLYMNAQDHAYDSYSDSDYTGSGGTGDSGIVDVSIFRKEPPKRVHKYTHLLPNHREACEETQYDVIES